MKTNKSAGFTLLGAILVILAIIGYIAELSKETPEINNTADGEEPDTADYHNAGPQMDEQLNHVA